VSAIEAPGRDSKIPASGVPRPEFWSLWFAGTAFDVVAKALHLRLRPQRVLLERSAEEKAYFLARLDKPEITLKLRTVSSRCGRFSALLAEPPEWWRHLMQLSIIYGDIFQTIAADLLIRNRARPLPGIGESAPDAA
jgi:hypothetical protein